MTSHESWKSQLRSIRKKLASRDEEGAGKTHGGKESSGTRNTTISGQQYRRQEKTRTKDGAHAASSQSGAAAATRKRKRLTRTKKSKTANTSSQPKANPSDNNAPRRRSPQPIRAQQPKADSFPQLAFRAPPYQSWHQVQYADVTADAQRRQVIIGLDFGTSYSKAVIRITPWAYAIPMESEPSSLASYLLPGILVVTSQGECSLCDMKEEDTVFDDLKVPLLQGDLSEPVQTRITAYLALLFRQCRGWLMVEKEQVLKGAHLDWYVNVGLPTDNALDQELQRAYNDIVNAAWTLSARDCVVTLEKAHDALTEPFTTEDNQLVQSDLKLHPDKVNSFPEFTAAIAAYVSNTRERQTGLHAMVDVGAGTLDVTMFNIFEEEGDFRYPIFARHVDLLGAAYLTRHRCQLLGLNNLPLRPQDPIPSRDAVAGALGIDVEELEDVDKEFVRKVRDHIREEFRYTKVNRHPKAPEWKDGVPTFLCGGGIECDVYEEALSTILGRNAAWDTKQAVFPWPMELEAPELTEDDMSRMAVAYGLSLSKFDIGELIRPENIEDLRSDTPLTEKWRENFVSKEME